MKLKPVLAPELLTESQFSFANLNQQILLKLSLGVRGYFSKHYIHSSANQYTIALD